MKVTVLNGSKLGVTLLMMLLPILCAAQSSVKAENDTTKLAYTYALQAFEELQLKDRQLENQKVITLSYKGIVSNKDNEIDGLQNAVNIIKTQYYQSEKNGKKKWWDGFLKGALVGILSGITLVFSIK